MARTSLALLAAAGCAFLAGCAHGPTQGILMTNVDYPVTATANQAGPRQGEACATGILGLIAIGDASILTAQNNGGIALISTVDQNYTSFLGFVYTKTCTIVRGR